MRIKAFKRHTKFFQNVSLSSYVFTNIFHFLVYISLIHRGPYRGEQARSQAWQQPWIIKHWPWGALGGGRSLLHGHWGNFQQYFQPKYCPKFFQNYFQNFSKIISKIISKIFAKIISKIIFKYLQNFAKIFSTTKFKNKYFFGKNFGNTWVQHLAVVLGSCLGRCLRQFLGSVWVRNPWWWAEGLSGEDRLKRPQGISQWWQTEGLRGGDCLRRSPWTLPRQWA